MAEQIAVKIVLEGNIKEQMRKASTAVKSGAEQMEKSTRSAASGFKQLAGAAAAFFGARQLISFFGESIRLANTQAQAEAQLEKQLGGVNRALLQQASALQKVTLFGDEETIGAQALLAAFTKEEKAIRQLTPLIQDLATKQGTDLKSAADLVGKTLGSSTNALSRYGIQVEGAVGSTERLESLTQGLARQVGGLAEAAAKAGTGPLQQFNAKISDAREQIGFALIPTLNELVGNFDDVARAGEIMGRVIGGALAAVKTALNAAISGVLIFGSMIATVIEKVAGVAAAIPEVLLPDGWKAQIQEFEASVIQVRKNLDDAARESLADTARSGAAVAGAFTGDIATTSAAIPSGGGGGVDSQANEAVLENQKELNRKRIAAQIAFYEEEVQAREDSMEKELELVNIQHTREIDMQLELLEMKVINEEEFSERSAAIDDRRIQRRDKVVKEAQARELKAKEEFNKKSIAAAEEATRKEMALREVVYSSSARLISELTTINKDASIENFRINQAASLGEAIINSALAYTKALASAPPPANFIAAGLVAASGAVQVANIVSQKPPAFATGGDFVTNGPQYIQVGDNPGGRERVQVTPLSSPNMNGPQSGITIVRNDTINIQGNADSNSIAAYGSTREQQIKDTVDIINEAKAMGLI